MHKNFIPKMGPWLYLADRCHGKNLWQNKEVAMGYFSVKVSFVKRSEELLNALNLLCIDNVFH